MHTVTSLFACLAIALAAVPAQAQDEDRPSLKGTWQLDTSKSDVHLNKVSSATWVIDESDNSIHITETENGKSKKTEMQCTTDGKECKFPGDRRASFWYNGSTLVEMETKNEHVTRFRMKVSNDGKTLTVEIMQIVPQNDKIDTLVFQKGS